MPLGEGARAVGGRMIIEQVRTPLDDRAARARKGQP